MYLDNCKRELLNYGVEAEIISVNKNGIPHEGLRLGGMEAGIHPIIYPKVGDSLEDVVNQAKIALEHIPDEVNWKVLSDWDYVKEHLYLSVQKHSTDQVFKRDCLNLELIMRVSLDFSGSSASTKVGSSLAKMLGVSEQELWDTAMKNCSKAYEVRSMSDILGIPTDADSSLYVVTTQDAKDGASALAWVPMTNFSIPFLSYTGSGTLVTYIMTGLVLSIYRNKSIVRDPKPIRIVRRRQYISAD